MTGSRRFILRMTLFLAVALVVAAALFVPILHAFQSNPALNALIFAVLLFGIAYAYRQVLLIGSEANWLMAAQRAAKSSASIPPAPPNLLAPIATLLKNRTEQSRISTIAMRSLLDSIASRLDESRDISRYLTGLLIFLGLLGTFWGLLQTVSSVGDAINTLNMGNGDYTQMFDNLKRGLEAPLGGMGTAFSSSLFGLAGSLVLGFLDLQTGQAQNRFYNDLEEWLSGMTRLSGAGPIGDGETSVPAYVQALLEQTAESLDNLQRTMARGEDGRSGSHTALVQLSDRLAALTDQMRTDQSLLVRLAEHQLELKPILQRLAQPTESSGLDPTSRSHLRNIELHAARLVEEAAEGRNRMVEELRAEIKLLARTIAATDERRSRS